MYSFTVKLWADVMWGDSAIYDLFERTYMDKDFTLPNQSKSQSHESTIAHFYSVMHGVPFNFWASA